MSLINCRVELKLKWINHCALSTNDKDKDNANSNNYKTQITCSCCHFISKRQSKTIKTS